MKGYSDLRPHANIALEMLKEHRLLSTNFLMYFLVNLLTFFTGSIYPMRAALVLLISLANTAKYIIVRNAFEELATVKTAKWLSFAMLFVYIIPIKYYLKPLVIFISSDNLYLGYVVPNVWHNSTILCMMPFAVACYLLSVKQFAEYSERRNWQITILLILSILVKPSFFFIYIVSFPVIMFSRYGLSKEFYHSLIPIILGCLCLAYEYLTIYEVGASDGSGVVINIAQLFTLDFWKPRISYLIVSFAFPILFVFTYARKIFIDREFWFILLMVVCSLGIMWCCQETGTRAAHGNFSWQAIAAMWFVYYYILKTIIKEESVANSNHPACRGIRNACVVLYTFGLHVIMGLIYLAKFLIFENIC